MSDTPSLSFLDVQTIGVVGAGQMGGGIAHVAALRGFEVRLRDLSDDALAGARATIEKNLARQVKKGRIEAAQASAALGRIHPSTELAPLGDAQIVVEAATENRNLKVRIFSELCPVLSPNAILCSNTSSISITDLARNTDRPERFMGMHFMNPVPVMKLIELIRGMATTDHTVEVVEAVSERLGESDLTGA